jgi:thiamine-phosphate pyrophosphorylase
VPSRRPDPKPHIALPLHDERAERRRPATRPERTTTPDLRLYLVTDTVLCGEFGAAATVAAAVAAGVTTVQLRDPTSTDEAFVEMGQALAAVLRGSGVPLIVNDRVHLVRAIGAEGAHIGQGDLDPIAARAIIGPDALLGLSVQSMEHLRAAERLPRVIDYLGVGPVWAQTTKPDAAQPGGLAVLADIVATSRWPCVAIGGIDAERAALVRRTGAAGVAVVSAICGQPDVGSATRRLRLAWDAGAES